jgi:hypothetical protein
MNASQLIDHVESKIQDNAYSRDEDILPLLNEAMLQGVSMLISAGYFLPALVATDIVTILAGESSADLPVDFYKKAISCSINSLGLSDQKPLRLFDNYGDLIRKYPGLEYDGEMKDAYAGGGKLIVQGKPSTDTDVKVIYIKKPTVFEDDSEDESPDIFPEELHRSLLGSYAIFKIMEEIEDGMEGSRKTDTTYYQNDFFQAVAQLRTSSATSFETPDTVPEEGEGIPLWLEL